MGLIRCRLRITRVTLLNAGQSPTRRLNNRWRAVSSFVGRGRARADARFFSPHSGFSGTLRSSEHGGRNEEPGDIHRSTPAAAVAHPRGAGPRPGGRSVAAANAATTGRLDAELRLRVAAGARRARPLRAPPGCGSARGRYARQAR